MYNYVETSRMAAFGTCSHCAHSAARDNGARTVTLSNVQLHNCPQKVPGSPAKSCVVKSLLTPLAGAMGVSVQRCAV